MTDEDAPLAVVLGDAIDDAINAAVSKHEGGFVTKWISLVESVDPEGARGLWLMTSDGLTAWDTLGMLQYAQTMQMDRVVTENPRDDD